MVGKVFFFIIFFFQWVLYRSPSYSLSFCTAFMHNFFVKVLMSSFVGICHYLENPLSLISIICISRLFYVIFYFLIEFCCFLTRVHC